MSTDQMPRSSMACFVGGCSSPAIGPAIGGRWYCSFHGERAPGAEMKPPRRCTFGDCALHAVYPLAGDLAPRCAEHQVKGARR